MLESNPPNSTMLVGRLGVHSRHPCVHHPLGCTFLPLDPRLGVRGCVAFQDVGFESNSFKHLTQIYIYIYIYIHTHIYLLIITIIITIIIIIIICSINMITNIIIIVLIVWGLQVWSPHTFRFWGPVNYHHQTPHPQTPHPWTIEIIGYY